jgi:hypothetical protein
MTLSTGVPIQRLSQQITCSYQQQSENVCDAKQQIGIIVFQATLTAAD